MDEYHALDTIKSNARAQETQDDDAEGENMLSIASERNNQKSYTMTGNPAFGANNYQSHSNHLFLSSGGIESFKELAIIVEVMCGRDLGARSISENIVNRQSRKGLDFYTFAEHFTRLQSGG